MLIEIDLDSVFAELETADLCEEVMSRGFLVFNDTDEAVAFLRDGGYFALSEDDGFVAAIIDRHEDHPGPIQTCRDEVCDLYTRMLY